MGQTAILDFDEYMPRVRRGARESTSPLRASLERIGTVAGGLLAFGTIAGLLGVTGWAALAFVVLGGVALAFGVGRWRSSKPQALAGGAVAVLCILGIGLLKPDVGLSLGLTGPPMKVAVQAEGNNCGGGWIVPGVPSDVKSPPGEDHSAWAHKHHAQAATELTVFFTVDTSGEEKVTLHDIRVVDVTRAGPSAGTHVAGIGCGGDSVYRWMSVDLDASPPKREFGIEEAFAEDYPPAERKPISFPYVVSKDDPESFLVFGYTARYSVAWNLEIDWSFQGERGTLRVDDGGSPFRVSSVPPTAAECLYVGLDELQPESAPGCPKGG